MTRGRCGAVTVERRVHDDAGAPARCVYCALFHDAARLYSGNHRYWYDTHPNLRRTAEDRAGRLEGHEVTREIDT
jgi:uncharacterized protein YydD (DUF2326 family)